MSVLKEILFLDPSKHPYIVVSGKGNPVARFSNLPCAARTVLHKKQKNPGKVVTPEGDEIDRPTCYTIVSSRETVDKFMGREVANGTGN